MKQIKKTVLFILHIPPPVHGSSIVGKQIMDSEMINSKFTTTYINLGTSKNVNDIGGWDFKKTIIYLRILFSILKKVIRSEYDLVYIAPTVSNFGFYKDFVVVFIVKLFQKKIIFHLHNKGVSQRNKNLINNFLYRFAFKSVDVILLSRLLYKDICEFVKEDCIHICPNGIEIIPNLEIELSKKSKNEVPTILFLSNLIESKGVFVLLEVLNNLQKRGFDFICNFVGGIGDITEVSFNNKVKYFELEKNVYYLGKKYDKEKFDIFSNSDIFILPTFNDCFPLVLLEAMQFRLPLISTYEGAIPEIIEDGVNGFLLKQKNIDTLTSKLEILISDKQLMLKMGEAAYEKYIKNYRLEIFESNMFKILNKSLIKNEKVF